MICEFCLSTLSEGKGGLYISLKVVSRDRTPVPSSLLEERDMVGP